MSSRHISGPIFLSFLLYLLWVEGTGLGELLYPALRLHSKHLNYKMEARFIINYTYF